MLSCARKKENTSGAALVESEVSRSKRDQIRDYSSCAGTRKDTAPTEVACSFSNSLSQRLKDASQEESSSPSVQAKLELTLDDSNNEISDTEGQLEVKLSFDEGHAEC